MKSRAGAKYPGRLSDKTVTKEKSGAAHRAFSFFFAQPTGTESVCIGNLSSISGYLLESV